MEVLWKMMIGILNPHLEAAIHLHKNLRWFCTRRGTGTTSLETKLLQQLMAMKEEVLYDIFYIYIRPMTPWTAVAALSFLQHMETDPGHSAYFGGTGTSY